MTTGNKTDLYDRIRQFQQTTLFNKPTKEEMIHEVRMMNFKVRPVFGNINSVDFGNKDFLDALWSLGKLDEFFRVEVSSISDDDRETFLKIIDDMRTNLQQRLNTTYVSTQEEKDNKSFFEIEIYKDVINNVN